MIVRPIDANKLLDSLYWELSEPISYNGIRRMINIQPTIDVESIRYGKWIEHKYAEEHGGKMISNFECSECHVWLRSERKYCGECGAKMEGD